MQVVLLKEQADFVLEPQEDTFYLVLLDRQAKQGQIKVELHFKKSHVACKLLFLGVLAEQSNWQLESNAKHLAANTSCLTEVYLSQADRSRVDYFGQIYISHSAQQTKSFLKEQILVMGEAVYNRLRPILEIFNNRVKASHSASSSRIDKADLFYLMSRGLDKKEAERILERAFFNKILNSIKNKKAKKLIKEYLC